ncbi:MAG: ATP-grasp domain-containing protein [Byssovorax sp.]
MPAVVFVAPFFSENAKRFLQTTGSLPGVALGLVSQDPIEFLPPEVRAVIRAHVRVADALDPDTIVRAARQIEAELGPLHRILGAIEQIQVPLAEARERLGLEGLSVKAATLFRDKNLMKDALRAAGIPVARHRLVDGTAEAHAFAAEVGYPLVVKPPAGAASQATYRAGDGASLDEALHGAGLGQGSPVLLEEFVTGQECSFEAFLQEGNVRFTSVTRYHPTPLEAMQNPWIQWVVVLPREIDDPALDDIRTTGPRVLETLGLRTGMCHLEWFRRKDGSLTVSEVAARPPGAQICTMLSRAHDVDAVAVWAKLMIFGTFDPFPPRKYACGAAFLRGQGKGRVQAVHGVDVIGRDLGHMVCDARIPERGQEKSSSYEGEGYILVRHPETRVVEDALKHIISTIRVEIG